MAKLKPGAITIDLVGGGIYGDVGHCDFSDLLESAKALMPLLPTVQHKGLWGLAKAFDADCYVYTTDKRYRLPDDLKILVIPTNRLEYFRFHWYLGLVGSVRNGKVGRSTTGIEDMIAPARAEHERWKAEAERRKPPKQLAMPLSF